MLMRCKNVGNIFHCSPHPIFRQRLFRLGNLRPWLELIASGVSDYGTVQDIIVRVA